MDIIYPPRCHFCMDFLREGGSSENQRVLPVCPACFKGLAEITSPLCKLCGRPFQDGIDQDHFCEECLRRRPFFDRAGAPYLYEGPMMNAIHQFKYEGKTSLSGSLGPLLAAFAGTWLNLRDGFLIMPVPLHPRRLRERGFNQSLLLARHLASSLDSELDFLSLRRIRYTQPQTGLKSTERRKNVRRAFEVSDPKAVKGQTLILVDDVATTGNTLNESARVLRRAGAEKVYGLVLARTSIV